MPISCGVAPTRLLAKIFASINKPYGISVALTDASIDTILATLPLTKTPYIADRMAKKIPECQTVATFKQMD
jgi:nucleotidyltransferase/DNA polymerase involved in DNA repair